MYQSFLASQLARDAAGETTPNGHEHTTPGPVPAVAGAERGPAYPQLAGT